MSKTGLEHGWRWRDFCTTQYASERGIENFLRPHLTVVRRLDYAKEIGVLQSVRDDGYFWETGELKTLVKNLGGYNATMAVVMGAVKDAATAEGVAMDSSIHRFASCEAMEATGRDANVDEFPVPVQDEVRWIPEQLSHEAQSVSHAPAFVMPRSGPATDSEGFSGHRQAGR